MTERALTVNLKRSTLYDMNDSFRTYPGPPAPRGGRSVILICLTFLFVVLIAGLFLAGIV